MRKSSSEYLYRQDAKSSFTCHVFLREEPADDEEAEEEEHDEDEDDDENDNDDGYSE